MRFFAPTANDPRHALDLYERVRERVGGTDRLSNRRIYRIRFRLGAKHVNLAVGDSFHELGNDPIMAILEEPSSYAICTFRHGAVDGEPFRVKPEAVTTVEEFEN